MKLNVETTPLAGLLVVKPECFTDERGFFLEMFRRDVHEAAGLPASYVQVNHSGSVQDVLRGLHFQWEPPMGKLMRVIRGEAFLVAVDIRKGSPTLGRWFGRSVSAESREMIFAPAGFARGFCVTSAYAEIEYLCTGTYNGSGEAGILWNDPEIGIEWPVAQPILSGKDTAAQTLRQWLMRPESDRFTF